MFQQKNDETFAVMENDDKKTDFRAEKVADDDDEDDDDDDEELTDFVPFSWNCDAIPQRSALKSKERLRVSNRVKFVIIIKVCTI